MSGVSPHCAPSNLAARMGRWSAHHRKTAIFGWFALVIAAFAVGTVTGTHKIDAATSGPGESGRADRILDAGFKQPASESVLVESQTLTATSPAFHQAISDVLTRLSKLAAVQKVRSPLDRANTGQIASGGHAALIEFKIRGDAKTAVDKIDPVVAAVAASQAAHPQLFIGEFGDASANKALTQAFTDDLKKAGLISLPLTLLILVVVFGALVAAGIPLLLALTAVFATMGLVAVASPLVAVDDSVSAVILLIGLAVGVDYSMFYLKREREERAAGRSAEEALEAAAATSGRAVLVSGLTVIVAMAGLMFTGVATFRSFGLAMITVVGVAMVGSLTVLPAVLSKLGDRVDRVRVPFTGRVRSANGEGRIWGAILDRVLRRPLLSVLMAGGLLLVIAAPALKMHLVNPGPETYPKSLPVMKAYFQLQKAFPGTEIPANVVVKATDVTAPPVQAAIANLKRQALASGDLHAPITVDVNKAGTVANIAVPVDGQGTDGASDRSLATLRDHVVPTTVGRVPDAEVAVTGITAESKDFNDQIKTIAPRVFLFVLLLAFTLMLFAFRSLVIAAEAIILNLLSVGAAYGVLVVVFQHGFAKGLLGFDSTAGVDGFLPIFLFVILFGLSMDYHVFILSRIREAYDQGMTTDEAITHGIKTTAGVVTSAAVVMVAAFSIFATLSVIIFKQFGVGLAVAILIDATLIRAVLLPATMKLLGEWNWYLPKWLNWLPHFEHPTAVEARDSAAPIPGPPALGPTG
jgi:uncharacterized membrane protein YdfJ with MMPL/SSD domain